MSTNTTFSIKRKTNRLFITLASLMSVFVLTFISTFIVSSVFAPISTSDAESVTINIENTDYFVTTEANNIDLSLLATPNGALTVGKDTVNTKTNCNGYQLYVSTASSTPIDIMNPDTGQVESVSANALILDGSDETSGDWIPATAGSFTAATGGPQAFKDSTYNNANTWGFAVPSNSIGLPSSGTTAAGDFDETYTTTEQGANLENKFAAVPDLDNPVLVQETDTPNTTTGVDLDVYYGVYASTAKTAGMYSNDVLYSIIAEAPNINASVKPSTITNMNGTSSITVVTPMTTGLQLDNADANVTVGGVSCPVTSILTKDSGGVTSNLKIVCTAPSLEALGGELGSYDVVANVTKFAQSYTITNGVTYSLGSSLISIVSPTEFDYDSLEDITINTELTATGLTANNIAVYLVNSTTSDATICPLSTNNPITYVNNKLVLNCTKPTVKSGTYDVRVVVLGQAITKETAITVASELPSFYTITTMQEMTPEICNSVYKPGPYTSYYSGTVPNIITKAQAEAGGYTATADGQNFIPETTLIDYRGKDGTGTAANPVTSGSNVKTYTVRKLADGNCWMTESLYLPLANNIGVEASYNDGSTFTYMPTSCSDNNECGINQNTQSSSTYGTYYYYNWFAATAGKGTSSTAENVDVDGSICPKGWKLPSNYTVTGTNPDTGTEWKDMSWSALMAGYGCPTTNGSGDYTAQLQASPLSLIRAGDYRNGSFGRGGGGGFYWSSTAANTSNAYRLHFDPNYLYPQGNNDKSAVGFNLRCVAVR